MNNLTSGHSSLYCKIKFHRKRWPAIVRQFQSPNSRGHVISLFVAESDGPENPQIFPFFFVLRAQKWKKIYSFHKNLFLCIYVPDMVATFTGCKCE